MTEDKAPDVYGQLVSAIWDVMKRHRQKIQLEHVVVNGHRELHVRVVEETPEAGLDDIGHDVVDVLRRAGHRLKTEEVITSLAKLGKAHGDSAVRHTLAQLVKVGILTSRKDTEPRGYGPAEWQGGIAEM